MRQIQTITEYINQYDIPDVLLETLNLNDVLPFLPSKTKREQKSDLDRVYFYVKGRRVVTTV